MSIDVRLYEDIVLQLATVGHEPRVHDASLRHMMAIRKNQDSDDEHRCYVV